MKYFEFDKHEYYALIAVDEKEGQDPLEKAYELYFEIVGYNSAEEVKEAGEPKELSYPGAWFRWKTLQKRAKQTMCYPTDEWMKEFNSFKDTVVILDGALA
ncbi:hypothetical protein CON03_07140 [Bacillus cereus]|nr:hypothetical protein CON03_07140 [Bacillus cereus]